MLLSWSQDVWPSFRGAFSQEAAARFQLAEDVDFKQPDPSGM